MNKKPKVAFVRGGFGACGYYRAHLPGKALAAKGWPVIAGVLDYEDFAAADILVFQRQRRQAAIREIAGWKAKGKKIVMDFDDNFFLLEDHNPAKEFYDPESLKWQARATELADAVTVTSQPLAESYRRLNRNIHVLPNSVDERILQRSPVESDKSIVGWQGGYSHLEDLRVLKSPINTLAKRFDFTFVLAGYRPPDFFKEAEFRPWVEFNDDLPYLDLIADFSIGLCPLAKTAFNDCKSDIKFLEYSALGIPTIASKVVVYSNVKHGTTGYLARNQGDWETYLARLLSDQDERRRLAENAKEYIAAERTIQANISRWEAVYESIA